MGLLVLILGLILFLGVHTLTTQRKLRAQGTRMLVDARVLGGWRKGATAVLVIEGTNGVGNIVRGAQLMELADGTWTDAGKDVIEFPPPA